MWSIVIVLGQPRVQVSLQVLEPIIELLPKRDAIKLILDGAMETLADAVGLRALGLGPGVVDVLDRQVKLVFVAVAATELGAAVGRAIAECW